MEVLLERELLEEGSETAAETAAAMVLVFEIDRRRGEKDRELGLNCLKILDGVELSGGRGNGKMGME